MRVLLAIGVILSAITVSASAQARHGHHRHVASHHFGRYLAHRHFRHVHHRIVRRHWRHRDPVYARTARGDRPSCFYKAASMGGPCGCWAGAKILGVVDHVWHGINLWLANDWLRFPHVRFEDALAVVWPGRHVAPVVAGSYRNGTIVVHDSWAIHRVSTAGLVPVRPNGPSPRRTYQVASMWPL